MLLKSFQSFLFVIGQCLILLASCLRFLTAAPTDTPIPGRWINPCGYADVTISSPSGTDISIDVVLTKLKDQSQRAATSSLEVQQALNV